MPIILALETSTEIASVALLYRDQMMTEEAPGSQTHSQSVLPMVQRLLTRAGITLGQCNAIAFGAGPGSFTGVRTACGIAQGLAFGAGLPVIPIVTLQAMAEACREATGATDVLALLDARMDEIYWARYRFADTWNTTAAPSLSRAIAVPLATATTVCGNGVPVLSKTVEIPNTVKNVDPAIMPHAKSIAGLAKIEFLANRVVAPRDAQPVYLRNKVALTTLERLAKSTT
jgi:tRNA threonylcarbamoyladenosine biosynthesis protein TsaB